MANWYRDLINDMLRSIQERGRHTYQAVHDVYTSIGEQMKMNMFTYRIVTNGDGDLEEFDRWDVVPTSRINEEGIRDKIGIMSVFVQNVVINEGRRRKNFDAGTIVFKQIPENIQELPENVRNRGDYLVNFYYIKEDMTLEKLKEQDRLAQAQDLPEDERPVLDVNQLNLIYIGQVQEKYLSAIPEGPSGSEVSGKMPFYYKFFGKCENISPQTGKVVGRIPGLHYSMAMAVYTVLAGGLFYKGSGFFAVFQTPIDSDLGREKWRDNRNSWFSMCLNEGGEIESKTGEAWWVWRLTTSTAKGATGNNDICRTTFNFANSKSWLKAFGYVFKYTGWGDRALIGIKVGTGKMPGSWMYTAFRSFTKNIGYDSLRNDTTNKLWEWLLKQLTSIKVANENDNSNPFEYLIDATTLLVIDTFIQYMIPTKTFDNFISLGGMGFKVINFSILQAITRCVVWYKFLAFFAKNICPLMLHMTGQLDKCPLYLKRDLGKKQKKELLDNPKEELKF